MKKSDYFYTFLLISNATMIVYGFLNYFWVMAGIIIFSSVVSFMVFLYQTKINPPVENRKQGDNPVNFYKNDRRKTYYEPAHHAENLKQANAD